MSVRMIQDRLDGYDCRSTLEEEQATREITQEIVLAALGRTDFFQRAGFQGGTCLRIFHGLNRSSEGLDFALQTPQEAFTLGPYLDALAKELTAYGYGLEVDDSLGNLLRLNYRPTTGPPRKLRVKLEVDANPPAGAAFETRYLDFPFPSALCVFDLPSLFAGKLHAVLCRTYLKGRDWYDFVWYTARKTRINHDLLTSALGQSGPWKGRQVRTDRDWCLHQLRARIEATNWKQARDDVRRFVKPGEVPSLDLWNREFFLAQCDKLT